MELTAVHAIGFIIMASTALLVLFYFRVYNLVKVLYAMGCSKAISQVAFDPLIRLVMRRYRIRNVIVFRSIADCENVSLRDLAAHLFGYSLGIAWLLTAFWHQHPEEVPFFWITQNLFGASMCM